MPGHSDVPGIRHNHLLASGIVDRALCPAMVLLKQMHLSAFRFNLVPWGVVFEAIGISHIA